MTSKYDFKQLHKALLAVAEGKYEATEQIIHQIIDDQNDAEFIDFLEAINFITVKLEAREFLLQQQIEEQQELNQELKKAIYQQELFSTIFTSFLVSTSIFIFLYLFINNQPQGSFILARFGEFAFLLVTIIIIKKSKMSLIDYGFNCQNAQKAIKESLIITIPVCLILLGLKFYLLTNNINSFNQSIFIYDYFNLSLLVYLPIVAMQELLFRGVAQTAVGMVMQGKNKKFYSILTVSCLFGLGHIQFNWLFALLSLFLGISWGYMYHRHRTIIGVTISHFLLGSMAYLLGFWDFLIDKSNFMLF